MFEVVVRHLVSCAVVARSYYSAQRDAARGADGWLASADTRRGTPPLSVSMFHTDGHGGRTRLATFPAYYSPERAATWTAGGAA